MMDVLQILVKESQSTIVALNDDELNIFSIAKIAIQADDLDKLKYKFLTAPKNEIEYVSIILL